MKIILTFLSNENSVNIQLNDVLMAVSYEFLVSKYIRINSTKLIPFTVLIDTRKFGMGTEMSYLI